VVGATSCGHIAALVMGMAHHAFNVV
jgi:hypothetical protein